MTEEGDSESLAYLPFILIITVGAGISISLYKLFRVNEML
jgi:hypothetical protein